MSLVHYQVRNLYWSLRFSVPHWSKYILHVSGNEEPDKVYMNQILNQHSTYFEIWFALYHVYGKYAKRLVHQRWLCIFIMYTEKVLDTGSIKSERRIAKVYSLSVRSWTAYLGLCESLCLYSSSITLKIGEGWLCTFYHVYGKRAGNRIYRLSTWHGQSILSLCQVMSSLFRSMWVIMFIFFFYYCEDWWMLTVHILSCIR